MPEPVVPREPKLEAFLRYWNRQRAGAVWPSRAEIDPVEIPSLLPNLLITEAGTRPGTLRVRLAGTAVVDWMGRDVSGSELDGSRPGEILLCRLHRGARKAGAPFYTGGPWDSVRRVLWNARSLACPLGGEDASIDQVISCITVQGFAGGVGKSGGADSFAVPISADDMPD